VYTRIIYIFIAFSKKHTIQISSIESQVYRYITNLWPSKPLQHLDDSRQHSSLASYNISNLLKLVLATVHVGTGDGGMSATWCGRTARLPIVHLSVFKILCIFAILHHLLVELKMQDMKKPKGMENAGVENNGQTFSAMMPKYTLNYSFCAP